MGTVARPKATVGVAVEITPDNVACARVLRANPGTYLDPSCRLFPPRELLGDCDPDRIFVGHGDGISEGAAMALADTLDGARQ